MATVDHDYIFKVVVVGDQNVGKTCLLRRYTENTFEDKYKNTIGCDFKVKNMEINNKKVLLQMWDTSGEERFRAITSTFYRNSDGLVIVFDLTNTKSFESVKNWLDEAEFHSSRRPIREHLLIGSKSDKTQQRAITFAQGNQLAKSLGMPYIETSAKDDINVTSAFDAMSLNLVDAMNGVDFGYQKDGTVTLSSRPAESDSWGSYCCSYM